MNIPFISDLGDFAVVPNFQGEWEFKNVYVAGSLVSYKGKLYEARTLVDQSQDAVVIGHDDFQRADTVDGWGTASDGTPWISLAQQDVGTAVILDNHGVVTGTIAGLEPFRELGFGSTELSTENIEILIKFSITGTQTWGFTVFCRSDLNFENQINVALSSSTQYNFFSETIYHFNDVIDIDFHNAAPSMLPLTDGVSYVYKIRASGDQSSMKVWQESQPEPTMWDTINISSIIPTNNFVILFFDANYIHDTVLRVSEFTILALPDAPDVNTTDWLLIG